MQTMAHDPWRGHCADLRRFVAKGVPDPHEAEDIVQDVPASIMGRSAWWSVPLAVLIGVPMYSNAAGVIPVVQALLAKGAALGTVLAFMMSVIALSLPEMIILRKVLKMRLIVTFTGVVAAGILIVGFVFNALL